jgi:hypothetical protein
VTDQIDLRLEVEDTLRRIKNTDHDDAQLRIQAEQKMANLITEVKTLKMKLEKVMHEALLQEKEMKLAV